MRYDRFPKTSVSVLIRMLDLNLADDMGLDLNAGTVKGQYTFVHNPDETAQMAPSRGSSREYLLHSISHSKLSLQASDRIRLFCEQIRLILMSGATRTPICMSWGFL